MSQLLNIFEFTTSQIRALASEQSVADAPIVVGDVTLIPVSKLSCGFSCGAIENGKVTMLNVSAEDVEKKGIMGTIKPILESLKEKSAAKKAAKKEAQAAAEASVAESIAEIPDKK